MIDASELERRLTSFVEQHVLNGTRLPVEALCEGRPDLVGPLGDLIDRYLSLTVSLDGGLPRTEVLQADAPLPEIPGFQTIERIGSGGMGDVYKLRDPRLNRTVAGKVIRQPRDAQRAAEDVNEFLREARALALFSDRRIVQIFEVRPDSTPPVIIMELVDGFELGRIGPSLDFTQRARVVAEICEAVHHAHRIGVQHRDLKPSNIMVDAQLVPRILDFGLSGGDPRSGHLRGTLPYISPEQLNPDAPIDARTDVYGLGTILYELLCGMPPFAGLDDLARIEAIRRGQPRLPVEIATVPEPLQAIALTAMEADPGRRYQSALDMAADLRRFIDGHPVLARPSLYGSTLSERVRPHLIEVQEWLRLRLIYRHEADRLQDAYRSLEIREDDWILESRVLSFPQIALYVGAFLLICGSLFYFVAARWHGAVEGIARPFAVLGLPFIGLNLAAHLLYRREHRAVAVAFYLGAVVLLPLFLLIAFHETGLFVVPDDTPGQLFARGVSNRQLQVTTLAATLWCAWLALRTKTTALSTVSHVLAFLFTVAIATDFGLREWLENGWWHRLALHLLPLVFAYAAIGVLAERRNRAWASRPAYTGAAVLLVLVLELLALHGKAFEYLGITLQPLQAPGVSDSSLIDTVVAMAINGWLFYAVAVALDRRQSDPVRVASRLLYTIAPFAMLQPIGWLVRTQEYSTRIDWLYAAAACAVIVLSHRRQRKSFYYAGVLNLGSALILIAHRREWFDRPAWAIAVVAAGLTALVAGFLLDRLERKASNQ